MASEAVTSPARPATGVPRPTDDTATTRRTPCAANAFAAGRVNPEYASSRLAASGFGGTTQKTASTPSNARSTTSASPCEPTTTSTRSRTSSGSFAGSRTITRRSSPRAGASSRSLRSTWLPMAPVGVVMRIMRSSLRAPPPARPIPFPAD